ncbi:hypothetical protein ACTXT7_006135 [Hymenolepis weldensis]
MVTYMLRSFRKAKVDIEFGAAADSLWSKFAYGTGKRGILAKLMIYLASPTVSVRETKKMAAFVSVEGGVQQILAESIQSTSVPAEDIRKKMRSYSKL